MVSATGRVVRQLEKRFSMDVHEISIFHRQRTTTEKQAFPPDAGSRHLSAHHFVESEDVRHLHASRATAARFALARNHENDHARR